MYDRILLVVTTIVRWVLAQESEFWVLAQVSELLLALVFRDEVYIHLSHPEPPAFIPGGGRAFVAVSGVDAVWERARSEAPDAIVQPLADLDYGQEVRFRVFAVSDPCGNTLRIGEPRSAT